MHMSSALSLDQLFAMRMSFINAALFVGVVVARLSAETATITPIDLAIISSTNLTTSGNKAYFVTGPSTRGTYALISSCFSTLFLCVWTAVHLNVPAHNHGKFRKLCIRLMYMTLGVFAPEYLLYLAFKQRIAAADLLQAVNRAASVTACTFQAVWTIPVISS